MEIKKRRRKVTKPRFNIERSDEKWSLVFLVHRYNYQTSSEGTTIHSRLKYSTGIKVFTKSWNGNPVYRSKLTVNDPQAETKNDRLSKIESIAKEIHSKNPTIEEGEYKKMIDYALGLKAVPKDKLQPTLLEYFQTYIDKISGQRTVEKRTVQKYVTAERLWREYFETTENSNPLFEDVTIDYPVLFANYYYEEKKWSAKTALKYISCLKKIMGDAYFLTYTNIEGKKKKINTNDIHNNPKFSVVTTETTKPVLELEDLEKLFKADLSHSPKLDRVRDLFLISAYGGGLRYSDFTRIRKENFQVVDGERVLIMNTHKGRDKKKDNSVVIPVLEQLEQILKKHNYQSPKLISSQNLNISIKELCKYVGITRKVILKKSIAGKQVEITEPIYDHITNHTARFTYINFMLNDYGVAPNRLKNITGQTLKTLLGYERADKKKSAKAVREKVNKMISIAESKKLKVVT